MSLKKVDQQLVYIKKYLYTKQWSTLKMLINFYKMINKLFNSTFYKIIIWIEVPVFIKFIFSGCAQSDYKYKDLLKVKNLYVSIDENFRGKLSRKVRELHLKSGYFDVKQTDVDLSQNLLNTLFAMECLWRFRQLIWVQTQGKIKIYYWVCVLYWRLDKIYRFHRDVL